ncbi:MAG: hypothetical protein CVU56_23230 [Deltaproteobacteria bacterium HGW-Deltaproteobacteria-14]|jgi:hypothetical protein|nr:MAG: hypothetical protein CVU56_23230 [Deltaproteobacteria bacterium HGW-Deltaproteobacteria-14]
MADPASEPGDRLALFVAAPPARVGGRLRVLMQQRGYLLRAGDGPPPPDGFALRISAEGRTGAWLHPDPPDAIPDALALILSQELAARVTTVLRTDVATAYEICERGRVVEKLAARGDELLEDVASPHAEAVAGGESLVERLTAAGLGRGFVAFDGTHDARSVVLTFVLAGKKKGGETIEIDPLVTCPICGEASVLRQGRFGEFYSCVRFPECRGRRTLAEARRLRAAAD